MKINIKYYFFKINFSIVIKKSQKKKILIANKNKFY